MTRLLLVLALLSGAACKKHDDEPPAVKDRAREPMSASDDDWTGALADRDGGSGDGGLAVALPAPGRPWTTRCGEVVDHMNALLVQSLTTDGASELEIAQLRKRIDAERGRQIEHCASRASEGEVRCILGAKSADNLAGCNPH